MLKILLLMAILLAPNVLAAPEQMGYIYDRSEVFGSFILDDVRNIKKKEIFDLEKELNEIISADGDRTFEEIWEEFMNNFFEGKAALLFGDAKKAIHFETKKDVRGSSVIWKYLNRNNVTYAYGFGNTELIMLSESWPQETINRLKQNEKVLKTKKTDYSGLLRRGDCEIFSIDGEMIIIAREDSYDGAMIRVIRDDEETSETYRFFFDSLLSLANRIEAKYAFE